jgi:hypothetical protein
LKKKKIIFFHKVGHEISNKYWLNFKNFGLHGKHGGFLEGVYEIELDTKTEYGGF